MKQRDQIMLASRQLPPSSHLKRIQEVHDAIARRAYDLFASRGFSHGHDLEDWFLAESQLLHRVPLEISETETELKIIAALPGFTGKDIEVAVEPHRLFISGERDEKLDSKKKGQVIHSAYRSEQVYRVIDLPPEVEPDKVKYALNSGKLEITLPKKEARPVSNLSKKPA